MNRAVRFVAVTLSSALLAAGCGGDEDLGIQIGLQRIALDLAFKAEAQAEKAEPQQALVPTAIPSQAEFAVAVPAETFDQPAAGPLQPLRQPAPPCPVADGVFPDQPVATTVASPPAEGVYDLHRTGTFAIESAVFPFRGLMPAKGEKEYRNVKVIAGTTDVLGTKAPDQFEYEVFEQTGDNFTSRSLRVTPTAIQLLEQVTEVGGTTITFRPTPPITLVGLGGGEGTSWNSAGIDTATGTSMVVQGVIEKRENVDLCGKVYDTYVVRSTERVTNIADQYTSQTNDAAGAEDGQPNTYWVATQYGGLFIQEEFHTTTTLTAEVGGAPVPVTLKLDYRNTFDSIEPSRPVGAS